MQDGWPRAEMLADRQLCDDAIRHRADQIDAELFGERQGFFLESRTQVHRVSSSRPAQLDRRRPSHMRKGSDAG